MAREKPEASAGPPPTADVQDPLPESTFFYRRVFSYTLSVALIGLLGLVVWRIDTASDLRAVAGYLCLLLFVIVTYYMIAPSAEQVVKMLQTAKMFTQGVVMRQTADASRNDAHAETEISQSRSRRRRPMSSRRSDFDAAPTSRGE